SPPFATPPKLLKFNSFLWAEQLLDTPGGHFAPAARRQVPRQREGAIAQAHEPAHPSPDRLEEPPHLAVAPFAQAHPVPAVGPFPAALDGVDALEGGPAIGELDAGLQLRELAFSDISLDPGQVLAFYAIAGMHESIGHLARVGEEKEPGGVNVQPPDGDPAPRRQVAKDRRPSLRVAPRDHLAGGLVVEEEPRACRAARRSAGGRRAAHR